MPDLKEELQQQRRKMAAAPNRRVDFQVDTLQMATTTAAYFSPDVNTITENYILGNDNTFNQSSSILAHEQKHRDNNAAGLKNIPMGLEQYYKICCYDEISASICELLQLRQEYLAAPDEAARAKIMEGNSKFSYYFTAVKNNVITPGSPSPADFDREMRFIAAETQNMWMNEWSGFYDAAHTGMTRSFSNTHSYQELAPNAANYQKARKIALNIGGLDFSQYLSDIPGINENMAKADAQIAAAAPREQMEQTIKRYTHVPQMSLEEFCKLRQHNKIADEIEQLLQIRKKYFAAQTPAEREILEASTSSHLAIRWLYDVSHGKLAPGKPDKLSAAEMAFIPENITSSFLGNERDYAAAQQHYITYKGNTASNPENYKRELKKIYTIGGMDFSACAPGVTLANPLIAEADRKIRAGVPAYRIPIRPYQETDLSCPALEGISGLSPEQQFQAARQKMFIENAAARCGTMIYGTTAEQLAAGKVQGFEDVADYALENFHKELQENPKLMRKWQEAEKALAKEIADQNKTSLSISAASSDKYAKALATATTINGINLQKYCRKDISTLLPPVETPPSIKKLQNTSWRERLGNKAAQAWQQTKDAATGWKNDIKSACAAAKNVVVSWFKSEEQPAKDRTDTKAKYANTHYTGTPKYRTWSPEDRVSAVQQATIYDFTKPFLKQQQQSLAEYEMLAANKVKDVRVSQKLRRRQNESAANAAVQTPGPALEKSAEGAPKRTAKLAGHFPFSSSLDRD